MNPNSKDIQGMITMGCSPTKEVTGGMFRSPSQVLSLKNRKKIYIIDVIGRVVKWAYVSDNGIGMVRTTKNFSYRGKRCIEIKGKKVFI